MLGSCEISVLKSPEVKHFSDLSELSDLSEKCRSLTDRAMKSSIHCASSIGEIKTLLRTDIRNILDVMESMNTDLSLISGDISIMGAHMSKLNAAVYEVLDMLKDKLKSYDEIFQSFDKKLIEYGDILKETNRKVIIANDNPLPTPRTPAPKPSFKRSTT